MHVQVGAGMPELNGAQQPTGLVACHPKRALVARVPGLRSDESDSARTVPQTDGAETVAG